MATVGAEQVDPARGERPPPARWYLVRTLTGRELMAVQHLGRQGFATFLPKQRRTVRHARRIRVAMAAFFPGYLFVRLDLQHQRWRSVNGTVGVAHLVSRGERPTPVPAGVVESLMQAADGEGVLKGAPLSAGQKVRVTAGAFSDQLGVIERLDGAGRVRVLLEIVNGRAPVTLDRDLISAAG